MKKILVLTTALSMFALSIAGEATLKLQKVSNNDLNITVSSDKDVYGLQFDVICDSKISSETVTNAFSKNDPRSNMEVHSRLREDGSVRVIMFDLTGQAIVTSQNAEEVLNINSAVLINFFFCLRRKRRTRGIIKKIKHRCKRLF